MKEDNQNPLKDISLEDLTKAISAAAKQGGKGYIPGNFTIPGNDPDVIELETLTQRKRMCRDPIVRQNLSLDICRARRKVRCKRADMEHWNALKTGPAPHRKKKAATAYAIRDFRDDNIILDDPADIVDNIEEFYQDLYNDYEPIPSWVF